MSSKTLGITREGLKAALIVKDDYRHHRPLCMPGDEDKILSPENLLDRKIDLRAFEDPLPLAMMATRDPEAPMALAAATRLSPLARRTKLIAGVISVVGESSHHPLVQKSIELIKDNAFNPAAIAFVQRQAAKFVVSTRAQYTAALRQNLQALLDGAIAPRHFVTEFFALTEAGNMRHQIRGKLVVSLLASANVRPSIKFLILENYHKFPEPVRHAIISGVGNASPSRHLDVIKDELRWIVRAERTLDGIH